MKVDCSTCKEYAVHLEELEARIAQFESGVFIKDKVDAQVMHRDWEIIKRQRALLVSVEEWLNKFCICSDDGDSPIAEIRAFLTGEKYV